MRHLNACEQRRKVLQKTVVSVEEAMKTPGKLCEMLSSIEDLCPRVRQPHREPHVYCQEEQALVVWPILCDSAPVRTHEPLAEQSLPGEGR